MGESSTLTTFMQVTPSLLAVMMPLIKFLSEPLWESVKKPAYRSVYISRLLICSPDNTFTELNIYKWRIKRAPYSAAIKLAPVAAITMF